LEGSVIVAGARPEAGPSPVERESGDEIEGIMGCVRYHGASSSRLTNPGRPLYEVGWRRFMEHEPSTGDSRIADPLTLRSRGAIDSQEVGFPG
jgi:hypothetical protein